ncbi:MAG: DEAD/DEAH box helicase [Chloroflexota bacterium]|nr:DEAD/DEAH box helicase [Chloroflexota bacterium]
MTSLRHPAVRAWFERSYVSPTAAQERAWPLVAAGTDLLLAAPTGSGKTLAAFLAILDRICLDPRETRGVRVLYVSPLKALNNDIQRNLDEPLAGIARMAEELGIAVPEIHAAVRTGDTVANERHRMTRKPPDILITTPESLYLLLTSPRARDMLRTVEHVIVDEIHAVAGTKRGSHLAVSLERLGALTAAEPQRIGLSATMRPLDEVGRFLVGCAPAGDLMRARSCEVVDAGVRKPMEIIVESPVEDFEALGGEVDAWTAIEPRLLELVQAHRTTLLFVNNRRSAERLTRVLNDLAETDVARAHHGSMSREERVGVEAALKAGELRCVVATGSLELGIDIGSVDLVVCVESPRSVARGLQRVGRSGHLVGQTSQGRIIPKFRGDLVESAAIAKGMIEGDVEPVRIPHDPLDVLAQQVVAMAAVDEWRADDLFALVRRAYPFRSLSRAHFDGVLAMLSGKYPSAEFGELRPRVVWDRAAGVVRGRPGSSQLALVSGGTIPDRGLFRVEHALTGAKLGELDEEMATESRPSDVFVLGARPWRITDITPQKVLVVEAQGAVPTVPFWKGDALGRQYETGLRVARLLDDVAAALDDPGIVDRLREEYALDESAAFNLVQYVRGQAAAGALPGERRIVVEQFRDELGDRRVVVHAPFGRMVLRPWSMALQEAMCRDGQCSDISVTDDGIHFRLAAQDGRDATALIRRVHARDLEEHLFPPLSRSSLFIARFRENAQRALLLPRLGPGRRTPLWLQRLRAADLLEVARQHDDFPIVYETIREIVEDWTDLEHLRGLLGQIESGAMEVSVIETDAPSPFAAGLVLQFIGDYFEEGERQQQDFREIALSLDRRLLRELLGTSSLRELLEPSAIAEVEARLQRTAEGRRARDRDEVEDLLVRLGALTGPEVAARTEGDAAPLVAALERERRAVRLADGRLASPEDRDLYEHPASDPASQRAIVRRYLATHGPVTEDELARQAGAPVRDTLHALEADGVAVAGEFTRGRRGLEWVDPRVLEEIHRATLAKLRREIEPRTRAEYARFLLRWHGLYGRDRDVRDVLDQLQGVWLPVETWERDVLPARVAGYATGLLDGACSSGEFVWLARRSSDAAKPRVAFFRRDLLPLLAEPRDDAALSPEATRLRDALASRGASFVADVAKMTGLRHDDATRALWELVFAGAATNDGFTPLRHVPKMSDVAPRALTLRDAQRQQRWRRIEHDLSSAGRWSLVWPQDASRAPEAERAQAWADVLLRRHGVVAYEHFAGEDVPLPWALVSDVLRRMEMRGEARRGSFVEGFQTMQYAHATAVERLRETADERRMAVVADMDPANAYGASLPAPGEGFARIPGAYLVLEGGVPVMRIEAGGKRLAPVAALAGERLAAAVSTLPQLLRAPAPYRGRRLEVLTYADEPAAASAAADALARAGFEPSGDAFVLWPSRLRAAPERVVAAETRPPAYLRVYPRL